MLPPPTYQHMWYSLAGTKSLTFRLRACSDARILLTQFLMITDYNVLELVIGADSNMRSLIRQGIDGPLLAEQGTGNILRCSFSQWFWIDWSRGVSMGNGYQVGDSVFLSLESMPIGFSGVNYFTIATGPGVDGDWDFSSVPGCV